MSIKAVLFDLDATLTERSLNDSETFYRILEQKGIEIPVEEVKQAHLKVKRELGDKGEEQRGKIPLLEFYSMWNTRILKVLGVEDSDGKILREIDDRWIDICGMKVYPDTKPALVSLRCKGLKIGIVSGNYEEEIRKMLDTAGLDRTFFDIIVGADTIKRRKPDPEVFRYALRQLEIEPQEAIYVGDDLERDYRSAERVGMNPLLIMRSDIAVQEEVRKIKSLVSLVDYLD